MEGETFETEDQRNWSDASFKTYGTPLHLPYPVEVAGGDPGRAVGHGVALRRDGRAACGRPRPPSPAPCRRSATARSRSIVRVDAGRGVARPAIGLGGAGLVAAAARPTPSRLRPLRLAHLRADLRLEAPGWEEALERAVANARAVDAPLEMALFLPDDPRPALRGLAGRASARCGPAWPPGCSSARRTAITADGDVGPGPGGARRRGPRGALRGRHRRVTSPSSTGAGPRPRPRPARLRPQPAGPRLRRRDARREPRQPPLDGGDDARLRGRRDARHLARHAALAGGPAPRLLARAGGAAVHRRPASGRPRSRPRWMLGFLAAAAEAGFASLTLLRARRPARRHGRGRGLPRAPRARRPRGPARGRFVLPRTLAASRARAGPRAALSREGCASSSPT